MFLLAEALLDSLGEALRVSRVWSPFLPRQGGDFSQRPGPFCPDCSPGADHPTLMSAALMDRRWTQFASLGSRALRADWSQADFCFNCVTWLKSSGFSLAPVAVGLSSVPQRPSTLGAHQSD